MTEDLAKKVSASMEKVLAELGEMGDRRSHLDRRREWHEWSEGVFKNVEATQADVNVVKADVKILTSQFAGLDKALDLLRKDHEHADEHWKEVKKSLDAVKNHGCNYRNTSHQKQDRVGHTGWDLVHKLTPANITLTGVIALLILLFMYHDKVLPFLGIG